MTIRHSIMPRRRHVLLALASFYLATALGFVPSLGLISRWLGRQALTDRFPCQDHACVCASAHECWAFCCCFSDHQRLVWAFSNGVLPPADAVFSDDQWLAALRTLDPDACELCLPDAHRRLSEGVAVAAPPDAEPADACCEARPNEAYEGHRPIPLAMTRASCKGLSTLLPFAISLSLACPCPSFAEPNKRCLGRATWPPIMPPRSRMLDILAPPPRA